jgi:hypothetical protein
MIRHIDTVLPVSSVLEQAATFLERCGCALEIEDEIINIPQDEELLVRSRASIKADTPGVFVGDPFEAVVLLGREVTGEYSHAKYGVIKMYFYLDGQFVSEDKHGKYQ